MGLFNGWLLPTSRMLKFQLSTEECSKFAIDKNLHVIKKQKNLPLFGHSIEAHLAPAP